MFGLAEACEALSARFEGAFKALGDANGTDGARQLHRVFHDSDGCGAGSKHRHAHIHALQQRGIGRGRTLAISGGTTSLILVTATLFLSVLTTCDCHHFPVSSKDIKQTP